MGYIPVNIKQGVCGLGHQVSFGNLTDGFELSHTTAKWRNWADTPGRGTALPGISIYEAVRSDTPCPFVC